MSNGPVDAVGKLPGSVRASVQKLPAAWSALFTVQSCHLPNNPCLHFSGGGSEWHAAERARLTTLGRTPSFVDGQIAAIARVNELTLVTANLEDFLAFAGQQVESWES